MGVVVATAQDGKVRDLKRIGGSGAALQRARHRVPHVEVSLGHVRRQVELEEKGEDSFV